MERKDEILEAASMVFKKLGFEKVTLADVAKECGLKKTALYYYFKNKEEMFQLMFLKDFSFIREQLKQELSENSNFLSSIKAYMIKRTKLVADTRHYMEMFLDDSAPPNLRRFAKIQADKLIEYEVKLLVEKIEQAVEKNQIRAIKPRPLCLIIIGVCEGLGYIMLNSNDEIDVEKEINEVIKIIAHDIDRVNKEKQCKKQ
jgi:AcrR family transcriptional regulator